MRTDPQTPRFPRVLPRHPASASASVPLSTSPLPARLAPILLLLFLSSLIRASNAQAPGSAACPAEMTCDSPVKGFFLDPPAGHLRLGYTGLGPDQPESCSRLCKVTKGCAFWMYHSLKPDGECKMWTHEQSPCLAQDPSKPTSTFFNPQSLEATVVGGPCKPGPNSGAATDQSLLTFKKSACPRLHCNSPHYGFLYDHPSLGHLLSVMTGRRKKPHSCYEQCKETPGCAFWMFDMKSHMGSCMLWSAAQSPCKPEPGTTDLSTAHFDPKPPHGLFLVGGNCKTTWPDYEDIVE